MSKKIYRLLLLSDAQLQRRAKLFAWSGLVVGALIMLGSLGFYLKIVQSVARIAAKLETSSARVETELENISAAKYGMDLAVHMIDACAAYIPNLPGPISGFIFVLGFLLFYQGILYLRLHEILNSRASRGSEDSE